MPSESVRQGSILTNLSLECHLKADGHAAELRAVAAAEHREGVVLVVDAEVVYDDFCSYA